MPITFFIPAYNCANTINEAIDSIIDTNFNDRDEIIIVDDCSTDDTKNILNSYLAKNLPIKVLSHLRNKGGAAARNTAVENASNDLLFCLDSDNVLAPNSIAPLKKYLLDNNADVATFQYQHFFYANKDNIQYTWSLGPYEIPIDDFLNGKNTPGQHGNYLFTKESWDRAGGYTEGTGALDTWTFGLKQAITGSKFISLKDTFYYHRLDDNDNSYWMRDAESKLWSVSLKITYALIPHLDKIEENFVDYMFGKGRYHWYYNLTNKPMILVNEHSKSSFYNKLHKKTVKIAYPPQPLYKKIINKISKTTKKWLE